MASEDGRGSGLLWKLGVPTAIVGALIAAFVRQGENRFNEVGAEAKERATKRLELYERIAGPVIQYRDVVCRAGDRGEEPVGSAADTASLKSFWALGKAIRTDLESLRPKARLAFGDSVMSDYDDLTRVVWSARPYVRDAFLQPRVVGGGPGDAGRQISHAFCDSIQVRLSALEEASTK